jgi:hypothetical protein
MKKYEIAVAAALSVGSLVFAVSCSKKSESAAPADAGVPASSSAAASAPAAASGTGHGAVHESMNVDGQIMEIDHPAFDMGRIQDVFDGSKASLARTAQANPAVLDLAFSKPRELKGIELSTATMDINLRCVATLASGGEKVFSQEYRKLAADPTVTLDFPGLSGPVAKLRVEISNPNGGDGHIHIRELRFL